MPFALHAKGGGDVGEAGRVDGVPGLLIAQQEGRGEDVARPGGIDFLGRARRHLGHVIAAVDLAFVDRAAIPILGQNQERDAGKEGLQGRQIIVDILQREDQDIQVGQERILGGPGLAVHPAISIPAPHPPLGDGGDHAVFVKDRDHIRGDLVGNGAEEHRAGGTQALGNVCSGDGRGRGEAILHPALLRVDVGKRRGGGAVAADQIHLAGDGREICAVGGSGHNGRLSAQAQSGDGGKGDGATQPILLGAQFGVDGSTGLYADLGIH